jgi:Cu/Ag efflux protein CusF
MMMERTVLWSLMLIVFCSLLVSCSQKVSAPDSPAAVKRYEIKGKVIELDKDKKRAKLDHQEVKGFMAPMTMWFAIKDEANFSQLTVGDKVTATLVYNTTDNRSWLEGLAIEKAESGAGS